MFKQGIKRWSGARPFRGLKKAKGSTSAPGSAATCAAHAERGGVCEGQEKPLFEPLRSRTSSPGCTDPTGIRCSAELCLGERFQSVLYLDYSLL